jgi:hypothetical protein
MQIKVLSAVEQLVWSRIPDRSTAALTIVLLSRNVLLEETLFAAASTSDLVTTGISPKVASILKIHATAWSDLEIVLLSKPEFANLIRDAIYFHDVQSLQDLIARADSIPILPVGVRLYLKTWQQPVHYANDRAESESHVASSGQREQPSESAEGTSMPDPDGDDRLKLDLYITPDGRSVCISCNTTIAAEVSQIQCVGCSATCHHVCWRKCRHAEWQNSLFVCILCRAQDKDLNKRVQMRTSKKLFPVNEQRCLECGSDISPPETIICSKCAGCFCVDSCALLQLKAAAGSRLPEMEWSCRWCSGTEAFDEDFSARAADLYERALQNSLDPACLSNVEAMTFFQLQFALLDQQSPLLGRYMDKFNHLLSLEFEKLSLNSQYLMPMEPLQLISFPNTTEKEAFACANAHACHFYEKAVPVGFDAVVKNAQDDPGSKIGILTSDLGHLGLHPTWSMCAGPLREIHGEHCPLVLFLFVSPNASLLKKLREEFGDSSIVLLARQRTAESKAKAVLKENLRCILFLDGHTGDAREVFGILEKTIRHHNLKTKTAVFCGYPGVYGGTCSATIVDRNVAPDKDVYHLSRTLEMPTSYHMTSMENRVVLTEQAAALGFSRSNSRISESALVVAFPGRLGRFSPKTQEAVVKLALRHPSLVFLFVVYATSMTTALNVFRNLRRQGIGKDRMRLCQALPEHENRLGCCEFCY